MVDDPTDDAREESRDVEAEAERATRAPADEVEEGSETDAAPPEDRDRGTVVLSDDEIGKTVVDASGESVGTVTGAEAETLRVEPDPNLVERLLAKLGWGEGEQHVSAEAIEEIREDEIVLTEAG